MEMLDTKYAVYILYSWNRNYYYCGSTSNLQRRIKQHNSPDYKGTLTTKRFSGPWMLIWYEDHCSRKDAMKREKQIKRRGIKRFFSENYQN